MAFFVNPALLEQDDNKGAAKRSNFSKRTSSLAGGRGGPADLVADKPSDEPVNQLFSDIGNFDIRKGACTNLFNPNPDETFVGTTAAQRSLLGQYEKDNKLFDVYQDLDPYEVKLRVNAFEKENFKLLSSSFLSGENLKLYLRQDRKSYLMEGQNREEMGKYLIENILIEKQKQSAMMLL